jgi:mannose-6-phosphate isomerase-like protein (cupin superfamily)
MLTAMNKIDTESHVPKLMELLAGESPAPDVKVWESDSLVTIGHGLLKKSGVAVMDAIMTPKGKEGRFDNHDHESREIMVVYSGRMYITVGDGVEKIVNEGEAIIIPSWASHHARVEAKTSIIAITIPADEDYADAGTLG